MIDAPDRWFRDQIKRNGGVFDRASYEKALSYCKKRRVALDVGAHVGSWSIALASQFESVYAIEPDPLNYEYLSKNTIDYSNIHKYNFAAGWNNSLCGIDKGLENSGQSHVVKGNDIEIKKIDSALDIKYADFIKFDVEGFEYWAMQGARKLIESSDAVVIWENNGLSEARYDVSQDQIKAFLTDCGYKAVDKVRHDEIWIKE